MRRESLERHPCYRPAPRDKELWHRGGGFGGTCARCGTAFVDGDVNKGTVGTLRWEPVEQPKPFEPGSLERAIYDTLRESGAPLHCGWDETLAVKIARVVETEYSKE